MAGLLRFPDAASLALHSAAFIASKGGERASTDETAAALEASRAHLSKVLQRLTRGGILHAARGPGGGYSLARPAKEITLKEVYEAMEGPLDESGCPFGIPACKGDKCALGNKFISKSRELITHLAETSLSSVRINFGGKAGRGGKRKS
jgi:Rrf2 family protein